MFEPIDEDGREAVGGDAACHAGPSQVGQKLWSEPMPPPGSAERATGDYRLPSTMGHEPAGGQLYRDNVPRSLPYSKTSDLDFLNTRRDPVPCPTTAALPTKQSHQPPSEAAHYDPDEVNRKVAAMLAATEALKPKSPPQSTRKRSMGSRVLSKLAGLFGNRRKDKPGKGKKKAEDRANPGADEVDAITTRLQLPFPTKAPYIPCESTESRVLAPGGPVERKTPRKPVPNVHLQAHHANVGDPSSSRHTRADPAPETGRVAALNVFTAARDIYVQGLDDAEHDRNEDEDYAGSQIKIEDPFESERSFDNLQGFLTTQPIGASTPRGSRHWAVAVNPPQDYFSPPDRMSHFSANDADDEMTVYEGRRAISQRRQGKAPESPAVRVRRASTNAALDEDDVEPDRAKKHPSPSKPSLEELSRRFNSLLYKQANRGEPSTNTATGLSPVITAFPRPPTRIPSSQTSALGTAEHRGLSGARTQAYPMPLSPTAQQLATTASSARDPAIQPSSQVTERRRAPRQLASGSLGAQRSRNRTGEAGEQEEDGEQYVCKPFRA